MILCQWQLANRLKVTRIPKTERRIWVEGQRKIKTVSRGGSEFMYAVQYLYISCTKCDVSEAPFRLVARARARCSGTKLKWTLFRHASALNLAYSPTTRKRSWQQIWSWCFNSLWESEYSGHWRIPVQISACTRVRCPSTTSGAITRARARCPSTTSGASVRARARCPSTTSGASARARARCPSTTSGASTRARARCPSTTLELVPVPGYGAQVLPLELVPVPGQGAQVLPLELVPVPWHGAQVLPLELVPVPWHGARVLPLELVPVPGHGAQICARAPTKGYVQTGARASLNEA